MTKEELEKLYRTWDNEKLLAAFQKRHDYTEEALEAMKSILKERNLSDFAEKEIEEEEKRAVRSLQEEQQQYETKMLGEDLTAKAYAQKNLVNGEYMSGKIAGRRFLWVPFLLFPLAVVTLILAIFSATEGPLFDYVLEISVILTILFVAAIIRLFRSSKAQYRLTREGNTTLFELTHGAYSFKATVPFSYFTFVDKMEFQKGLIKVSHPILFLCMTNKDNETVVLQGNLTALQSPPPTWPHVSSIKVPKGARFFNEMVGHPVNVIKLKKILDGVHGMDDNQGRMDYQTV